MISLIPFFPHHSFSAKTFICKPIRLNPFLSIFHSFPTQNYSFIINQIVSGPLDPELFLPDPFIPKSFNQKCLPDSFIPNPFSPEPFRPDSFIPNVFHPELFLLIPYIANLFCPKLCIISQLTLTPSTQKHSLSIHLSLFSSTKGPFLHSQSSLIYPCTIILHSLRLFSQASIPRLCALSFIPSSHSFAPHS